jgi:hypothetical protein
MQRVRVRTVFDKDLSVTVEGAVTPKKLYEAFYCHPTLRLVYGDTVLSREDDATVLPSDTDMIFLKGSHLDVLAMIEHFKYGSYSHLPKRIVLVQTTGRKLLAFTVDSPVTPKGLYEAMGLRLNDRLLLAGEILARDDDVTVLPMEMLTIGGIRLLGSPGIAADPATVKSLGGRARWVARVKEAQARHKCSYKDAMHLASSGR